MSMALRSPAIWKRARISFLDRLLVAVHAHRVVSAAATDKMPGKRAGELQPVETVISLHTWARPHVCQFVRATVLALWLSFMTFIGHGHDRRTVISCIVQFLLSDKEIKDYGVYKPAVLFFGLVDAMYRILWSQVSFEASTAASTATGSTPPPAGAAGAASSEASWSSAMSDWIRNNDQAITEALPK